MSHNELSAITTRDFKLQCFWLEWCWWLYDGGSQDVDVAPHVADFSYAKIGHQIDISYLSPI